MYHIKNEHLTTMCRDGSQPTILLQVAQVETMWWALVIVSVIEDGEEEQRLGLCVMSLRSTVTKYIEKHHESKEGELIGKLAVVRPANQSLQLPTAGQLSQPKLLHMLVMLTGRCSPVYSFLRHWHRYKTKRAIMFGYVTLLEQ